jgi:hypothetical protein
MQSATSMARCTVSKAHARMPVARSAKGICTEIIWFALGTVGNSIAALV